MSHGIAANPELQEIFRVLWRQKAKVILVASATMCVLLAYLVVTPKKYKSEAKLLLKIGRENVGLDPTATTGQTMKVEMPRTLEINSAIEMLESKTLLGKVVDVLGAEKIQAKPSGPAWVTDLKTWVKDLKRQIISRLPSETASADAPNVVMARDDVIKRLQKSLKVSSPRETTVINVACEASTPELAREIVSTVVNVYIGEHMRLNRTPGSLEFFAEQSERLRQELAEVDRKLSELKSDKRIVSVAGQLQLLEAQKSEIELEQLRIERQSASSRSRYRALKQSSESLDEIVLTQRAEASNLATDGMRQQLYELEIQDRELSAKFNANHPAAKAARRQLEIARKILESETTAREHTTFAVNPNWRQLQLNCLQEASQLAGLESTGEMLDRQRTELAKQVRELNAYALQVADLQRESDRLADNHKAYSVALEQARIDAAIEDQRLSNVSVIQEATLAFDPVGIPKRALAALGLVVAIIGGVGLAWVFDYADPRLKSPTEVEQVLSIPVLISLPRSAGQRVCIKSHVRRHRWLNHRSHQVQY